MLVKIDCQLQLVLEQIADFKTVPRFTFGTLHA